MMAANTVTMGEINLFVKKKAKAVQSLPSCCAEVVCPVSRRCNVVDMFAISNQLTHPLL